MKQRKEMIKFGVCIALLFTLNVLSSFCKPQTGADNESYLDFEILDEQSKTCRLKRCVLKKIRKVDVPETVVISGQTYRLTTIGLSAFYNCDSLEKITLPNSVTKIEKFAFSHCDKLTSITLPNSLIEVKEFAFSRTPLSQVIVPKNVKAIGVKAFDCNIIVDNENPNFCSEDGALFDKTKKSLLSVPIDKKIYTIPKSVEIIAEYAFRSRTIKEVIIPNSVTSIGKCAFVDCWQLSEVVIPNSVEVIGDSAFWQCKSLTQVTLPNSLKEISSSLFEWCTSLKHIEIPNSVTVIGKAAFAKTGLTHISIPESTVKIGDWAFFSCYNLSQVTVSDSLLEIGNCAFKYCENLKQITIPSSTKTVGDWVFPQKCEVVRK